MTQDWATEEFRHSHLLGIFGEPALRALVSHFEVTLYPQTYEEAHRRAEPWARYQLGHLRYSRAQEAFRDLFLEHGIAASVGFNRSYDAHAFAVQSPIIATIHRQRSSTTPPRRAAYRGLYATASRLSQAQFSAPEFGDAAEPILVDDAVPPEYVNFGHGASEPNGLSLGFFTASFVRRDGAFVGRPIDLLTRYRTADAPISFSEDIEDVGQLGQIAPKLRPEERRNRE